MRRHFPLLLGLIALVAFALPCSAAAAGTAPKLGRFSQATEVIRTSEGKLLVAGATGSCPEVDPSCARGDIALARLLPAGQLDRTFGGGDGIALAHFPGPVAVGGIDLAPDGKIAVAGTLFGTTDGSSDIAVAILLPNGSPDPSFDGNGFVATDLGGNTEINAVVEAGGAVTVAGWTVGAGASSDGDFLLARYTPAGDLDTAFDGDGIVTTDFNDSPTIHSTDTAFDLATVAGGSLLAAGATECSSVECESSPQTGFALARYEPDGDLDPSFGGGDGIAETAFATAQNSNRPYAQADEILVTADGKVVLGGERGLALLHSTPRAAIARFHADGSLDASFGGGDGQVVGRCETATALTLSGARLLTAGRPDACLESFSATGVSQKFVRGRDPLRPFGGFVEPKLVEGGGLISAGLFGYRRADGLGRSMALVKFRRDGSLGQAFGVRGLALLPDVPRCGGRPATIFGNRRSNRLLGTLRPDVIAGGGGADMVAGGGSNDLLCGGRGGDRLRGGAGADGLWGGFGNDVLRGGPGRDRIIGGPGRDQIQRSRPAHG